MGASRNARTPDPFQTQAEKHDDDPANFVIEEDEEEVEISDLSAEIKKW